MYYHSFIETYIKLFIRQVFTMQDIVVKCGGSNKEETEIAPAFKMLG